MRGLIALGLGLLFMSSFGTENAEAKQHPKRHYHSHGHGFHHHARPRHRHIRLAKRHRKAHYVNLGTVVAHPSGCPWRAFCGCGASVRLFGHPVRSLYLAANWLRFPQASPAPGMAAARYGHVFVIERVVGPGRVLAYDANSGRHLTRIHERSLAGYRVVNPHGRAFASRAHYRSVRHARQPKSKVAQYALLFRAEPTRYLTW